MTSETEQDTQVDRGQRRQAHPRMAKRASKVKAARQKRRIRRRVLLVLSVILLAVGGLWIVYFSPFFDVDKIQFSGVSNASMDRISGITDDLIGDPIAQVDLEGASDQISELPWVKEVNIKKSWWGGDISVSVIERTPVAVKAIADGYALVGREGKILQNISQAEGFPVIEGVATVNEWVQESQPALETAEELGDTQDLKAKVRAIVVTEDGELYFDLIDGGWIRLGDSRELSEKFSSIRTVLRDVGVRCDQMLDVRTPLATAMTSKHQC